MSCNCGCGGTLPCGCCEGVEILTPATIGNRPGLDAIEYRAGTHGTFLETMKANLAGSEFASLSNLKTRNSDDPSLALLDAWATVGDVLTFYQERIANEGYLRTATERRSVLELARLVGYSLRPGVAASAYLAYTLDKPVGIPPLIDKPQLVPKPPDTPVTIPVGSRAQSIPGPGELPQSFETSADLVARFAWNDLQVRLHRPQKIDGDTRVIYLKGLINLKPGDPILIIASPPNLFRVETVTPDAANDRTKVTFRPWLEVELPAAPSGALGDAVAGIVKRFSTPERFGVVRTSKSGREVLAQLERLRKLESDGTPEELRTALEQQVLPRLNELHQAAIAGRFTRVEPWVRSIVDELEGALQGRTERPKPPAPSNGPAKTTANLTTVLPSLAKPPSIPPKTSQDLSRSIGATLGSNSDIASQVLTSLKPELKPILYKAWENVPVTAEPGFEVHSFKVRASVFGHNAPLEPVRNTAGVITGSKEWDLQLPAPTSTESFELVIRPQSEGPFQTRIILGQFLTQFVDLSETAATNIDFPAANDRVDVRTSRTADGTVSFEYRFSRRPIRVRVTISLQQPPSATSEAPVTIEQPTRNTQTGDVSTRGRLTITGTGATREEPRVLWLDSPYDQILPGGWVALEKPSSVIDTVTFLPLESTLVIAHATDVSERSRAEYGISLKSTRLRLDSDWIDPTRGRDSFDAIRGTAVFAGSERLELAEEPIEDAISGNELELDGLYDGLESGRWLIVIGERADVVASVAQPSIKEVATEEDNTEVQVAGVPATELVMLAAVEQRFDPSLEGDKTHTYLRLANNLAYSYKRDTVIVYGNVVNSTHGETRKEVLGSGNAAKSLQEFTLKQSPLTFIAAPNPDGVESTLQVRVNDVLWHEADTLADLGPNDYRYITRTDDQNKTSIVFGTGENGARLPTGPDNVTAVYRNGIGKAGNVRSDQISLLASKPLGVKAVTNPIAATGGADRESRDQAKRNAPLAVTALDRLVSTQDYADFALTFAGIGKASAARLSDGQRRLVHLTVAGADDIPIDATSDLYRNLNKALRDFGDPHQPIAIVLRTFLLLVIEARVRVLPDYLFEKVEPKIRAALLDRFSFERRELGQDALLSDAMATIQNVEGVAYVDVDKFDWIDEKKVVEHLAGGDSLGDIITRKGRVVVSLARVDTNETNPAARIKPAEIAYMSPSIPDTIILSEIAS
jgi:predicted phage baseplate assembly protein